MSNVLVFIFLFFEGSKIADGGPYIDFLLNEIDISLVTQKLAV